jgi:hypothetical protein
MILSTADLRALRTVSAAFLLSLESALLGSARWFAEAELGLSLSGPAMRFTSIARTLNVEKVRLASDLVRRPSSAMARHRIVDQQHHHRTNDCNDHAVDVQAIDAACTKQTEHKATDERANDAQGDVEPEALAVFVDDFAPDETGNQAKYDPANDTHLRSYCFTTTVYEALYLPDIIV